MKVLWMRYVLYWLLLIGIACALVGCGESGYPNLIGEKLPELKTITVDLTESTVRVSFVPYDGWVGIKGWYILPSDPPDTQRKLTFDNSALYALMQDAGWATFTVTGLAQPEYSTLMALPAGTKLDFQLTVTEVNQHTPGLYSDQQTWQYWNGKMTRIE